VRDFVYYEEIDENGDWVLYIGRKKDMKYYVLNDDKNCKKENEILLSFLSSKDWKAKKIIIGILRKSGDSSYIPVIINMLKENNLSVITSAIEALNELCDINHRKVVLKALESLMKSDNKEIVDQSIKAINKIKNRLGE
jgi:hypothetical protein